jgi:hypothetical protein
MRRFEKDYAAKAKEHLIAPVHYFRNLYFNIQNTSPNGNCFFEAIVKACAHIGQETTIDKLRTLVMENMTYDVYKGYAAQAKTYAKDAELNEATLPKLMFNEKNRVVDFDMFRARLLSKEYYWGDDFAIGVLEQQLALKLVVYKKEGREFNMNCVPSFPTAKTEEEIQAMGDKERRRYMRIQGNLQNPRFFILLQLEGNHYDLITYRGKGCLAFVEVPFIVRTELVEVCLYKRRADPDNPGETICVASKNQYSQIDPIQRFYADYYSAFNNKRRNLLTATKCK